MINAKNCAMQHKKNIYAESRPRFAGSALGVCRIVAVGRAVPSVQAAQRLDRSLSRDQLAGKYVVRA